MLKETPKTSPIQTEDLRLYTIESLSEVIRKRNKRQFYFHILDIPAKEYELQW